MVSPGTRLLQPLVFCVPCLVPKNLRVAPDAYDGGLLSVWDACNLLMKTHAHHKVLPCSCLCRLHRWHRWGAHVGDHHRLCVHPDSPV